MRNDEENTFMFHRILQPGQTETVYVNKFQSTQGPVESDVDALTDKLIKAHRIPGHEPVFENGMPVIWSTFKDKRKMRRAQWRQNQEAHWKRKQEAQQIITTKGASAAPT